MNGEILCVALAASIANARLSIVTYLNLYIPNMKKLFLSLFLSLGMAGSLVAAEFSVEGTWNAVTTLPSDEERPATVVLTKKDATYEGMVSTSTSERALKEIKISNESVSFAVDFEYNGTPITFTVKAKPEGENLLKGNWVATGEDGGELATGDWKADREIPEASPIAGDWKATAEDPDGNELAFDVKITEAEDKLSGTMKSDAGSLTMKTVTFKDGEAKMEVGFPYDGQLYPVTISAKVEDDKMSGNWVALNSSGEEEASGTWKAVRPDAPTIEGAWDITATMPNEDEYKAVYHFESGDDPAWKGKAVSETGELAFEKVEVEDGELVVDMELPYEGETVEVRVKAKMSKDGKSLEGKWVAFDTSGQEAAQGAMKGSRKTES